MCDISQQKSNRSRMDRNSPDYSCVCNRTRHRGENSNIRLKEIDGLGVSISFSLILLATSAKKRVSTQEKSDFATAMQFSKRKSRSCAQT